MKSTATALFVLFAAAAVRAAEPSAGLEEALKKLDARVLSEAEAKAAAKAISDDLRARRLAVNLRETAAWNKVQNKADWERFRDERIAALRRMVGEFPEPPKDLKLRVTKTIDGDGFKIENVVFESRKDLLVTANVYSPANPPASMPAIVVIHSHHNPKVQGELQDMGMLWARAGCVVLVPDQIGHGERRQQPFGGRQDYFNRFITGMQLHVVGDSLIGWMAYDMSRCVDVLLARPGVDPKRVALLGSVAGGGDPCGVAAALDPRFTCVVPFNFGGPQPETTYPLPMDAEAAFNFAGGGGWESTRNISFSCRDGFLPWVIVGSVAPRHLIHAHEFAWDKDRDPVWKRYQKIFGFYNAADNLSAVHGFGQVTLRPPAASHCNNIGDIHRKDMHTALNKWWGIKGEEYKARRPAEELLCLPADGKPKPLFEVARDVADERISKATTALASMSADQKRAKLRSDWAAVLGISEKPPAGAAVKEKSIAPLSGSAAAVAVELTTERGLVVPVLLLLPRQEAGRKVPVVVAAAFEGKQRFLRERADGIAELLSAGVAVCLADVRGTGETGGGDNSGGRRASGVGSSSNSLMLGEALLGARLTDLRAVLAYAKGRADVDRSRVAVWGDSFAPVNAPDREFAAMADDAKAPASAQPMGATLALLAALFDDDVKRVYAGGGITAFRAYVEQQFCYIPHDMVVPGAVRTGDLPALAAALSPRAAVMIAGPVDGLNRRVPAEDLKKVYSPQARVDGGAPSGKAAAAWLTAK